jgi:hypothetical protein
VYAKNITKTDFLVLNKNGGQKCCSGLTRTTIIENPEMQSQISKKCNPMNFWKFNFRAKKRNNFPLRQVVLTGS